MLNMDTFTNSTFIYYTTASSISMICIVLMLSFINWPFAASAVLGVTLFIHALMLSRSIRETYLKAKKRGLTDESAEYLRNYFSAVADKRKSEA
jgi:ABC-type transport system involved in cytochrome bd biosynthesis fused ATPase/permease subunit